MIATVSIRSRFAPTGRLYELKPVNELGEARLRELLELQSRAAVLRGKIAGRNAPGLVSALRAQMLLARAVAIVMPGVPTTVRRILTTDQCNAILGEWARVNG